MKIITILGTRPEIIRLSTIIPKLDKLCDHILVHTGQNFTASLNDIFFSELNLRSPNYMLECKANSMAQQISLILTHVESVLLKEKPDKLLILGDTNSSLSCIIAKRMGIEIFHMEAGNRCFDNKVPEEVNRRIIDHTSDILLPYTNISKMNLLKEGIDINKIYMTGNPIYEVLKYYEPNINHSNILEQLKIKANKYFLITLHRQENVDCKNHLSILLESLKNIQEIYQLPIIVSTHPRTRLRIDELNLQYNEHIKFLEPFGFFDFIKLEQNALCVLTDSGTVQEECAIFQVPNVTLRSTTERPETLEAGSNIITGINNNMILTAVKIVLETNSTWPTPTEYLKENVSDTVIKILFSNHNIN